MLLWHYTKMASSSDGEKKFKCSECSKSFRDNYNLKRHSNVHNSSFKGLKVCPICSLHIQDFDEHLKQTHGIGIKTERLKFPTMKEFEAWKEKVEKETNSRYVRHRGPVRRKDKTSLIYYYCHRDGNYTPKGKNIRNLKAIGSNKMNADCPSTIRVEQKDKSLSVLFKSTHVGHTCDVYRMVLTKSEKDEIAAKVNMQIPSEDILDEIRNTLTEENFQRIHLTTKQDIRNIIASYGLENVEPQGDDTMVQTYIIQEVPVVDDLETRKTHLKEKLLKILDGIQSENDLQNFENDLGLLESNLKKPDELEVTNQPGTSKELLIKKICPQKNVVFLTTEKENKKIITLRRVFI